MLWPSLIIRQRQVSAVHSLYGMNRKTMVRSTHKGYPSVHAGTIFSYLYKNRLLDGIPKALMAGLDPKPCNQLNLAQAEVSDDKSVKFLFTLPDGFQIESVLMPEKTRITLCVSSQVGCQRACSFCHTGRMGLSRNLHSHEIIGQLTSAHKWVNDHPEWLKSAQQQGLIKKASDISHVVFMGMGEALDNLDACRRSIRYLRG